MSILSILKVLLTAENTEFKQKMEESKKKSADFSKTIKDQAGQLIGASIGIGLVTKGLSSMIREAAEAERVDARLNAVLKSTGGAAGMTADELDELASSTSRLTGVDADLIKNAETVLLTFTKVGEDVFPRAISAALDMSEVMGQDLQSSIVQLGKALNDPIEGVSALRRVGVSFTAAQQEQIKTLVESGNQLEAQNMILKELQVEFGGAAKAAGETFSGGLDKAKLAVMDLAEALGEDLLPGVGNIAEGVADLIYGWIKWEEVDDRLFQAVKQGIITNREMDAQTLKLMFTTYDAADAEEWLNKQYEEKLGLTQTYAKFLEEIGERTYPTYIEQVQQAAESEEEAAEAQNGYQFALQATTKSRELLNISEVNAKRYTEDFRKELERVNQAARDSIVALREAKSPMEEFLDSMDRDIGSPMEDFIKDIKFMMAGGADYKAKFEAIKQAMADNKITPEEAKMFTEELFIELQNTLISAGEESKDEAAQNISDALGVPVEDAQKLFDQFTADLEANTKMERVIRIRLAIDDRYGLLGETYSGGTSYSPTIPTVEPEEGGWFETPGPPRQGPFAARRTGVVVNQNFYGAANATAVRRAAREGVLEAARARGMA